MKTYIIAEAGVNHNGDFKLAKELVKVASECGADAVKFQTFKADKLTTKNVQKAKYQSENNPETSTQKEMLKQLELTNKEFVALSMECAKHQIDFLTTCFDKDSLSVICEKTNPKLLKIGSGDLTNLPLIIEHAKTGRDIIISTGMATFADIEDALAALAFGYLSDVDDIESYAWLKQNYYTAATLHKIKDKVTILHCVTDYPARHEDLNLDAIRQLKSVYDFKVGYSDHSLGIEACCAALTLGATCLEKHLTLDKKMPGPDHAASASPDEFKMLVDAVRNLEKSLVPGVKAPTERERANIKVARTYLVASEDISKGEVYTKDNLTVKRAGKGILPSLYWDMLGSKAKANHKADDSI